MKKHLFYSKVLMFLTLMGMLSFWSKSSAQTITTTLTNNNGSSVAVFSFQNNNPDPVILTDIGSIAGVTNTYTCHLYVKPATYNVAPGAVGAITAVNGWTLVASNNNLPLTGNMTTATAQSFITGMSYVVPGNTHVRFALQLATGTNLPAFTATTGSLRYSTLGLQQGVWSAGGCDVNVTTNYGYGGTLAAATFTPRGFIGFVTFISSVACSGTPNAGTASISSSVGCPNASFNLSASGISFGSGLTYQWQSSPDGNAPWTDVIGGNSSSFATSTPTNLFYRLRSFCSNSNQENFSNTVSYTVSGGQCACGPYPAIFASNAADEEITNVTVGTMNNSSACGILAPGAGSIINRYGNFTGSVSGPSEMQGATVSFSLTQTSCGGSFGNGFQVYVDWNQDGDFLDADEQVYNQPVAATGNHTKTGTFTVPISALTGTTRMRVVNAEVTFPTATNYAQTAYTWGETEDYCFTVSAAVDCAGTPNPGSTLSTLPNPCSTESFTLSLQNLTSGSGVSYQWQTSPDGTAWTNAGAAPNSPSWTLTHAAATWYRCVVTCGPSAQSTESNGLLVGTSICFCTPVYTSGKTLGDLISNVEITGTTLANNSGTAQVNPAYTYFTGQPNYTGDLQAGTSYSVNISVGTWGNQHIRAWIDYNDNGIFEPSESIGSTIVAPNLGNVGPFPPASFNISLACNPPSGVHRMRIRNVWQSTANPAFAAAIDPCISYGFGETEDYDVNVLPPPPCPSITNLVVSNITQTTADISWTAGCVETGWDISVTTTPSPGAPIETNYGSTAYTITGLTTATTYWVHVRANCGVDGESSWITTSFTTNPPLPACTNAPTITNLAPCSATSIQASWAAVPLADGYNIYVGTSSGVYDIANPFFNAAPEVFLNNPVAGQTYYFLIVPTNLTGEAIGCIEYSHTAPDACPPPINDLICDALDVTSSGQQDLNTYAFLADLTCNNQLGTNQLSTAGPVGPNCGGSNGPDVWYTFTTPSCNVSGSVPFQIELTTNNPGTLFDSKLALYSSSDNTCSGVLTQIACNDDNGGAGNPAICGVGGGLSSTLVVSNLLPNTQYWVYIGGFGGQVGDFELSGRALTPAHNVTTTGGGTQIQLTTANMGAGLYTYYYKQVGSTGYSTFNSASALTDTRTLAPGNSYQTQIMYRCGTNSDQSQWYRTAPQTIALSSTCAIVNNMTCTFNGPNSYTLSWPQPSGVLFTNNGTLTGYRIKRTPVGSSSVFTFSNPDVVCANGTCSVTLPGNSPTGFNWTIETRCSANTVQVGNTTSCAPAPQFEVNNDANNNIARTFENVYSFVNAETGIEFVDVQMFDAYADFGLNTPMIGDYEMYVNSKNEITWRRVDASVDMSFDFIIVPNPSNAMTTVHLNTVVETGTFTIVDAMGRTINSGSINNTDNVNIDAAQLQSGVYMVVVTVGNQQLTRRLVVAD